MKKSYLFLLTLFTITFFSCKTENKPTTITTVLIGEVVGRDYSKTLSLITKNGDYRVDPIEIPITNGRFNYTLKSDFVQQFQMAFNDELARGSWMGINFYNDKDTIQMTLFSREKADYNIVFGGDLNNKYDKFNKKSKNLFWDNVEVLYETKVDSLEKINQWNSKEVAKIYIEIQNEKDFGKRNLIYKRLNKLRNEKKDLTPQARVFQNRIDTVLIEYEKWKDTLIKSDNTVFGYSLLMDKLFSNKNNKEFNFYEIGKNLENYQTRFKNHPYTLKSVKMLDGILNIKVDGDYIDFSSKTKNDNIIKTSPFIAKNNLTLIDLWAPWCGPCIAKSKKLKPEYSKLKEKGFDVFAVIGGIDSKDEYIKTKEKYNYPWQVNYELNNEFNIWYKYNISRSGGSQFLVDSKGKILAINPEPKEIDSILNSMIKIKL